MDHFEEIVAFLLEADGYWTRRSYKVDVTKEEKRQIGKPSIPRPEIDLLAFNFRKNEIVAFEAKSYLDSYGVKLKDLIESHEVPTGGYKLFTCAQYQRIVLTRLLLEFVASGMANAQTSITLGLAAGNVYRNDALGILQHFNSKGWVFWSPTDIKTKVTALAARGYENNAAVITAKILMR